MSFSTTLNIIREITHATLANHDSFQEKELAIGICTDSRHLRAGEIFLALRGEQFDGHHFLTAAGENGAIACIVEEPLQDGEVSLSIPQLVVNDTLVAYQQIAHWWRQQLTIPIIAITGSVGKTTTKELIAAVLGKQGNVLKTHANYNNEIGVPKTLLSIEKSHDFAVVEMGMRGKGEIALLSQIAQPDIAVITNVGTAHIGRLGSEQAIADAKCELLAEMPQTSTAILNYDCPRLIETAAKVWQGKTITYGLTGGEVQGKLLDSQTIEVDDIQFPLPLPGEHNAVNYLSALAVAKSLGIDWQGFTQGLSVNLPGGRSRRCELPADIVLLDETYNAGLESTLAALQLLKGTPGKRHIAVLGTMKELGDHSARLHRQVGETVKSLGLDQLFVLINDPEAKAIADGADSIPSQCMETHEALIERLLKTIQSGDRLLFKASNSVQLNRVVESLIEQYSTGQ